MGHGGPAAAGVLAGLLLVSGCTSTERDALPPEKSPTVPTSATSSPATDPTAPTSPTTAPERPLRAGDFSVGTAMAAVRHLAGAIGPRHATSPEFRRAAAWVTDRFEEHGLAVRRQEVAVPGGDSWGVPVAAGTSYNVVAEPPGFDPTAPHLVVGAHLDTVPQAPGAEDNASGVGVVLAVAEALADHRTRVPVVLVAFGAEEPRGDTDDDHHYGSRAYVASLPPAQRRAVRGMLSLDRVGVGTVVPVCAAIDAPTAPRAAVLAAGERAGVPTQACENSSSDHWSFVRAGLPGVRIGGTSYAAYHSEADVPAVVSTPQVARVGRLVLSWLAGPRSG